MKKVLNRGGGIGSIYRYRANRSRKVFPPETSPVRKFRDIEPDDGTVRPNRID
jgi:hypothetical protein